MFGQRFVCSWIGALGLAAGAFGQTYAGLNVAGPYLPDGNALETYPTSINQHGDITGFYVDSLTGTLDHGF